MQLTTILVGGCEGGGGMVGWTCTRTKKKKKESYIAHRPYATTCAAHMRHADEYTRGKTCYNEQRLERPNKDREQSHYRSHRLTNATKKGGGRTLIQSPPSRKNMKINGPKTQQQQQQTDPLPTRLHNANTVLCVRYHSSSTAAFRQRAKLSTHFEWIIPPTPALSACGCQVLR